MMDGADILLQSAVDLIPSKSLRDNDEAMCEMLETICNPTPPPDWKAYGQVRMVSIFFRNATLPLVFVDPF